ncbi:hypothetical protein J2Y59_000370 [Arcicella sp. BE139]|nr:hypothetical protein [Arcicella sp. BE51]MDR6821538.1 hypothetical protein [Arcicella sp. BE139]
MAKKKKKLPDWKRTVGAIILLIMLIVSMLMVLFLSK